VQRGAGPPATSVHSMHYLTCCTPLAKHMQACVQAQPCMREQLCMQGLGVSACFFHDRVLLLDLHAGSAGHLG
jgi:hypothetical protein